MHTKSLLYLPRITLIKAYWNFISLVSTGFGGVVVTRFNQTTSAVTNDEGHGECRVYSVEKGRLYFTLSIGFTTYAAHLHVRVIFPH